MVKTHIRVSSIKDSSVNLDIIKASILGKEAGLEWLFSYR